MSEGPDRILPLSDNGIMLRTAELTPTEPTKSAVYRIQTATEEGDDTYELSTWIVEKRRMPEFFTDYIGDEREVIDIRPFIQGHPVEEAEKTEE